MSIVSQFSWDDIAGVDFNNPARKAFREAVEEVAQKAREALPESEGRILKAVQLVLAGDVTLLENGSKARVSSQSNGTTEYFVVNGTCQCRDFSNRRDFSDGNAPDNFCKHRLAYGIYKRAYTLAKERLEAQDKETSAAPEPTSPVEVPGTTTPHIPAQFLTEIHGKVFVQYAGLLAMAHERGLVNLSAHFISVNNDIALAEATAEFADGKVFKECADATPGNVNAKIRPHFPRMALTRSKARALRDALNIGVCSVEEMEET
jgi:hypothetical protein